MSEVDQTSKQRGVIFECPDCYESSETDKNLEIRCSKCNHDFRGSKFTKTAGKAAIGGTITFFAVLLYAGNEIDDRFLDKSDRYTPSWEYQIVDICVRGEQVRQLPRDLKVKRAACTCAISKVSKEYKQSEIEANIKSFWKAFQGHALACLK